MDAKAQSVYASVLEVLVGAWVMLVPVFTSVTGAALVSTLITGGVIALAGLVQIFWENVLPSWIDVFVAVWLFISAYVFSYSTAAIWNLVLAAVATFLIALWDVAEVSEVHQAHHQRMT